MHLIQWPLEFGKVAVASAIVVLLFWLTWRPTNRATTVVIEARAARLLVTAGCLGAVTWIAWIIAAPGNTPELVTRAVILTQLAVFSAWFLPLLLIARLHQHGPQNRVEHWLATLRHPRRIAYLGIAAHLALLVVGMQVRCSTSAPALRNIGIASGGAVLSLNLLLATARVWLRENQPINVRIPLLWLTKLSIGGEAARRDAVRARRALMLRNGYFLSVLLPALFVVNCVPFTDTLCFLVDASESILYSEIVRGSSNACTTGSLIESSVGVLWLVTLLGGGISSAFLAATRSAKRLTWSQWLFVARHWFVFELAQAVTLAGPLVVYASWRLKDIVWWQHEHVWGVIVQPVAFLFALIAATAESRCFAAFASQHETERLDPEKSELWARSIESTRIVASSALLCTVFLGGWSIPFVARSGILINLGGHLLVRQPMPQLTIGLLGLLAFVLKTAALCWLQIGVHSIVARIDAKQLIRVTVRRVVPVAVANAFLTGFVVWLMRANDVSNMNVLRLLAQVCMLAVMACAALGIGYALRSIAAPTLVGQRSSSRRPNWGAFLERIVGEERSSLG